MPSLGTSARPSVSTRSACAGSPTPAAVTGGDCPRRRGVVPGAVPNPADTRDELRDLRSLGFDETVAFVVSLGAPKFRGEQIWRWVHGRMVDSIEEMTNLPRELRARLAEVATVGTLAVAEVQTSRDGT